MTAEKMPKRTQGPGLVRPARSHVEEQREGEEEEHRGVGPGLLRVEDMEGGEREESGGDEPDVLVPELLPDEVDDRNRQDTQRVRGRNRSTNSLSPKKSIPCSSQ